MGRAMSLTVPGDTRPREASEERDGVVPSIAMTPIQVRFAATTITRPGIAQESEVGATTRTATVARNAFAYAFIQRVLDVVLAGTLLVLAAPFLGLIAVAIWLDSDGPILYRAVRIGRAGKPIHVMKFRTMRRDSEEILAFLLAAPDLGEEFRRTFKLRQDPRCTRVGSLLRRSSLDELPQFLNVLKGEMAVVGPRPIVAAELDLYRRVAGAEEAYLAAKPGITGLWQISGRSNTSYRKRIFLDRFYVMHRSTALDLWILAKTPVAVIKRDGAY